MKKTNSVCRKTDAKWSLEGPVKDRPPRARPPGIAMKWRPSSPDLLKTFDEVAPPPPLVRRKMFGYPAK